MSCMPYGLHQRARAVSFPCSAKPRNTLKLFFLVKGGGKRCVADDWMAMRQRPYGWKKVQGAPLVAWHHDPHEPITDERGQGRTKHTRGPPQRGASRVPVKAGGRGPAGARICKLLYRHGRPACLAGELSASPRSLHLQVRYIPGLHCTPSYATSLLRTIIITIY